MLLDMLLCNYYKSTIHIYLQRTQIQAAVKFKTTLDTMESASNTVNHYITTMNWAGLSI